jgi:thymidylate synthase (FAD)
MTDMQVTLTRVDGDDLGVVNAARVSFDKESDWELFPDDTKGIWFKGNKLPEGDQKLISYLAKHDHWSPFAHVALSSVSKLPSS